MAEPEQAPAAGGPAGSSRWRGWRARPWAPPPPPPRFGGGASGSMPSVACAARHRFPLVRYLVTSQSHHAACSAQQHRRWWQGDACHQPCTDICVHQGVRQGRAQARDSSESSDLEGQIGGVVIGLAPDDARLVQVVPARIRWQQLPELPPAFRMPSTLDQKRLQLWSASIATCRWTLPNRASLAFRGCVVEQAMWVSSLRCMWVGAHMGSLMPRISSAELRRDVSCGAATGSSGCGGRLPSAAEVADAKLGCRRASLPAHLRPQSSCSAGSSAPASMAYRKQP